MKLSIRFRDMQIKADIEYGVAIAVIALAAKLLQ